MTNPVSTLVPQNNSVKTPLIYFEGDFRSREQIRQILDARKQRSRDIAKACRRRRNPKRKPILMFGLNTIKA